MKFFFFKKKKTNGVKKRGDTELECKTGVKHNSKFKNTFSKIKFYLLEKKEVNKRNRKKKKQVDKTIRRVFVRKC